MPRTDDEILDWYTADLGYPSEWRERVRKTMGFQSALLAERVHDCGEAIVAGSPRWLHRLVRRVLRQPA